MWCHFLNVKIKEVKAKQALFKAEWSCNYEVAELLGTLMLFLMT